MKDFPGFVVLLCCFGAFAWWQVSANAEKSAALKVQAEKIQTLEERAERVDKAVQQWRADHENIAGKRQEKRVQTRATARKDASFKEYLETPLHRALLPADRGGSGLLGAPGRNSGSITAADPAP